MHHSISNNGISLPQMPEMYSQGNLPTGVYQPYNLGHPILNINHQPVIQVGVTAILIRISILIIGFADLINRFENELIEKIHIIAVN